LTNLATTAEMKTWTAAQPVSIETGFDLATIEGQTKAWQAYEEESPDLVVIAFPCSPWSSMQNMQMNTQAGKQKVQQKQAEARVLVDFAAALAKRQGEKGKVYVLENPVASKAWKEPGMAQVVRDSHVVTVDMCTQGLKDPMDTRAVEEKHSTGVKLQGDHR